MNDCTAPFVFVSCVFVCACDALLCECRLACACVYWECLCVLMEDDWQFCVIVTNKTTIEDWSILLLCVWFKCSKGEMVVGVFECTECAVAHSLWGSWGIACVCVWPSLHFTSICRAQGEEFQPILERSDPCQTRLPTRLKRQWVHLYTHKHTHGHLHATLTHLAFPNVKITI